MPDRPADAYVLNEWQVWRALPSPPPAEPAVVYYTDHPFLYEILRKEGRIVGSPTVFVGREEQRELLSVAMDTARLWQGRLDAAGLKGFEGVHPGKALGRQLVLLLNTVLFRARQMEDILNRHPCVTVPVLSGEPQNHADGVTTKLAPLNCNYYAALAPFSGQGDRLRVIEIPKTLAGVSRENRAKDVEAPGPFDLMKLFCLRLLADKRLVKSRIFFWHERDHRGDHKRTAGVFLESHYILDVLPALRGAGFAVKRLSTATGVEDGLASCSVSEIESLLLGGVIPLPRKSAALNGALRFSARRVAHHVVKRLFPARLRCVEAVKTGGKMSFVLSNGIGDSEDALFQQEISRRGAPFITFEHGGIGLTEVDTVAVRFADRDHCDAFVAHNPYEDAFYRRHAGDDGKPVFIRGVAHLARPISGRISRWVGRSFLKVSRGERLILYFPTRFREDSLWLGYETSDVAYWLAIKELVEGPFAACGARVFIKLHQKGWRPGQRDIYELRRHPLEISPLPINVRFGTVPQLNYLRWAADLIVIDRATSTIQWALMEDVPLVYLDLPFNPLVAEVRAQIERSVFYVDAGRGDWKERLSGYLSADAKRLAEEWSDKAGARQYLRDHYISGPPPDDAAFLRWVESLPSPNQKPSADS